MDSNKGTLIAIGIGLVAVVIAALALTSSHSPVLGNKTASFWDSLSYRVSGTEVISSSRGLANIVTASVGTFTQGGGTFATTSNGSVTLDIASVVTANVIAHTNTGATTFTLPASSTMTSFIPNAGDARTILYDNLGNNIDTIAGGTGTTLHVASSTVTTALKTVAPSGSAILIFHRKSNTDVIVDLIPAQ